MKFVAPTLAPPFVALLAELKAQGFATWIVGGWVRDAAMGRAASDADFCTDADDAAIVAAAERTGVAIALDRVAAVHGTYKLVATGQALDLARLRRDVARVGARHAQVTFTRTLEEDLARRDLTINALALPWPLAKRNVGATLVDAHDGLGDLQRRRLRLIGDPEARLQEDPLRLLRIARFACLGSDWQIDAATHDAMVGQAAGVHDVSVERRAAELTRALALPRPERFFEQVGACRLTSALFGEALTPNELAAGTGVLSAVAATLPDPQLRFAAFLWGALLLAPPPPSKGQSSARTRALAAMAPLRLAKAWQEHVGRVVAGAELPDAARERDDNAVARWALALGPQALPALATLVQALHGAYPKATAGVQAALQRSEALRAGRTLWRSQDLHLDANALFAELNVPEGALRRWLLAELLLHVWHNPQDNNQAALVRAAHVLNPTEGQGQRGTFDR